LSGVRRVSPAARPHSALRPRARPGRAAENGALPPGAETRHLGGLRRRPAVLHRLLVLALPRPGADAVARLGAVLRLRLPVPGRRRRALGPARRPLRRAVRAARAPAGRDDEDGRPRAAALRPEELVEPGAVELRAPGEPAAHRRR